MNEMILPLLALFIPLYWMWRTHIATLERMKLLKEIDDFLSPESGNADIAKEIIYNAYEDSKKHFFAIELLYYILFKIKPEAFKESKKKFEQLPKEQQEKMQELLSKILFTNIKLSPLTYFTVGFMILVVALVVALFNYLSPVKIKAYLQALKERTFYSIYCL